MYLAHLEKLTRTRLEDVLVEEGVLERARVEEAQAEQEQSGRQLSEILIQREIISDYDLAKLVATHYALPFLDVSSYSTRRDVTELLPLDFCMQYAILPLDQFGLTMTMAICEMPPSELIEEIAQRTKLTPFFFVAVRHNVIDLLKAEQKRIAKAPKIGKSGDPQTTGSVTTTGSVGGATKTGPAKPVTAPVTAAATTAPVVDDALPDLELPSVSMKLVGGPAGGSKSPPAPARPTVVREAARDSVLGSKSPPPVAGAASGALSWMDTVGGPKSPNEPPRPKIDRFPFPKGTGAKPGAKEPTGPVKPPTGPIKPGANVAPAAAAAGKSATTMKPSAPAQKGGPGGGGGAWQSIFDVAEEAVKKDKPK